MKNVILGIVLLAIFAVAAGYIYKAKKRGVKCIGCPAGAACSGACKSGGCGNHEKDSCSCHSKMD